MQGLCSLVNPAFSTRLLFDTRTHGHRCLQYHARLAAALQRLIDKATDYDFWLSPPRKITRVECPGRSWPSKLYLTKHRRRDFV
jgi:hypothetical protein